MATPPILASFSIPTNRLRIRNGHGDESRWVFGAMLRGTSSGGASGSLVRPRGIFYLVFLVFSRSVKDIKLTAGGSSKLSQAEPPHEGCGCGRQGRSSAEVDSSRIAFSQTRYGVTLIYYARMHVCTYDLTITEGWGSMTYSLLVVSLMMHLAPANQRPRRQWRVLTA